MYDKKLTSIKKIDEEMNIKMNNLSCTFCIYLKERSVEGFCKTWYKVELSFPEFILLIVLLRSHTSSKSLISKYLKQKFT